MAQIYGVFIFTCSERFVFTLSSAVANHRNLKGEIVICYNYQRGLTLHPLAL